MGIRELKNDSSQTRFHHFLYLLSFPSAFRLRHTACGSDSNFSTPSINYQRAHCRTRDGNRCCQRHTHTGDTHRHRSAQSKITHGVYALRTRHVIRIRKSGRDGLLAQAAVLEALRDGPMDHRNFDYQPILLEKLPSLKDGDAAIAAVTVRDGEELVDASGGLVKLAKDVKYFDSDGVERVYDGKAKSVRAMQMTVTFKLKQGLKWENGQPLTADDVAFAWQLAKSPDSPTANHFITNRMKDPVVVVDSRTIRWTYMPGYKDSLYYARLDRKSVV